MQDNPFKKLTNINETDATLKVKAQARYYPDHVEVYVPNVPISKLKAGIERSIQKTNISDTDQIQIEDSLDRSFRRTKRSIRDYVLCNNFSMFATFTFAEDRQNILRCKTRMNNWLRNEYKRKGVFKYLIVPEFHKDKQSLHFHALLENYKGEVKRSINALGKPILQRRKQVYELPSYTHGFSNVKHIDTNKPRYYVALYLMKYVAKDMPVFPSKNRFWASQKLSKPIVQDNPETWYITETPDYKSENEYGQHLVFKKGSSVLVDMFLEASKK